MNDNDFAQNRIHAKFQPVGEPLGWKFQDGEPTRLYLEYDGETGIFEEYDGIGIDEEGLIVRGSLVATGVIEKPERVTAEALREAA